jgi:hypothetical protein
LSTNQLQSVKFEIKFWKFKNELGKAINMKLVHLNAKSKLVQEVYLECQCVDQKNDQNRASQNRF